MSYIKDRRRGSMLPNTLDQHIRPRELGPGNVMDLDVHTISQNWVTKHRLSGIFLFFILMSLIFNISS